MIKAVFFDAGNTLFRPYPSVGAVYARLARRHGVRVAPAWINARFAVEWRERNGLAQLKDEKDEKLWWRTLVRRVFGSAFRSERKFDTFYEDLFTEFAHPRTWRLYPDALPVLRRLKNMGLRLGIVSNWDSRLFGLCDGLGVTPFMDFILASAVEGTVKPEREIFRRGLRKAGLRAEEAVHVGDSYREDYWGAKRAGLHALLLRRDGSPGPEGADHAVSLEGLFDRVGRKESPALRKNRRKAAF